MKTQRSAAWSDTAAHKSGFVTANGIRLHSVCANRKEKNRLAAVSAALGLTISIWGAAMSFLPEHWLDRLVQAPAWLHCIAAVILWAILTEAMYFIFRASRK
jgi:xanthine/uracil permease